MSTPLRYETEAAEIYKELKAIPRTGWVMRGVTNPETVYDHTVSLMCLAERLSSELELSTEELNDLKHILEIHDWPEALAGDEFVPNEDKKAYEVQKKDKALREQAALQELLTGTPYQEIITELFLRYESGADPIAKLAKELDKYQALELALQYEVKQNISLFTEFDEYYTRATAFTHPVILSLVKDLRQKHAAITNES